MENGKLVLYEREREIFHFPFSICHFSLSFVTSSRHLQTVARCHYSQVSLRLKLMLPSCYRRGPMRCPGDGPRPLMRKNAVLLFLLVTLHTQALATWSVIAVDRKTGQVVIASATCVPQQAFAGFPAKGLKDVQAIIIPGVGVAAAQANVDRTRQLQKLIANELNRGTDPGRIIDMLKVQDQNHPSRQYGIVDLKGR